MAATHHPVTGPLNHFIKEHGKEGVQMYACGPWPMMQAADELARKYSVPCEVSLEARMGCSLGACMGCVVRTRGDGAPAHYIRVCTEGPVIDSRRIDWAATARSDKPIVRTYRAERNQRVISLLDNGRTMAGQVAGVARVEHAMDAVMMLTSVAARMGDMAGLVAFDRQLRAVVPPASRSAQLGLVTEALYRLQPELTQSDYRGAFVEVLARFQRRAMLCLLTELDEAIVDTLVPSLPMIARTHLLVVGAVRDPAVAAWAASMPKEMESAYRGAAAAAALARRRELATLLQGHGAVVVDALPGRLGPELTDTYLAAKASGRL